MSATQPIRPLRRLLQSQLTTARRRPVASVLRNSAVLTRSNASIAPDPDTTTPKVKAIEDALDLGAERLRLFRRDVEEDSTALSTTTEQPNPIQHLPSLLALYGRPLKREAEYGVPTCNLQLRSFNPRTIEFFADFALRAAYYLGLPASGPIPLPKRVERWTVPKSHFIFKKTQENFERITYKRLIQITDGNMEAVYAWLAYLQKRAIGGVGMKANVWEFSSLGVGKNMDQSMKEVDAAMDKRWQHLAGAAPGKTVEDVKEVLQRETQKLNLGRDFGE